MADVRYRLHGVVKDRPPSEVAPDFWTDAVDMQVRDEQMSRSSGAAERITTPDKVPHFMLNTLGSSSWWVYVQDNGIFQTDGTTATNIATTGTPAGFALGTWAPDDVTGGLLNGIPYLLVGTNQPVYWPQAGNCANTTNWLGSGTATAKALWTYKNHVFAGDLSTGSDQSVAWTDAVDPSSPAADWDQSSTAKEGGQVELADAPGAIMNGLTLRGSCIVYKDHSAYIADYVGGAFVFRFRLFSRSMGLLARHAAIEIEGSHLVVTDGDVVMHDGQTIRSVMAGAIRRSFFSRLSADHVLRTWAAYNREQHEAWICAAVDGADTPNMAAVLDLDSGRWGFRDLGEGGASTGLTTGALGIVQDSSANFTYSTTSEVYSSTTLTYDETFFAADQDSFLTTERTGSTTSKFVAQDIGTLTSAGSTITGTLERADLDAGEPDLVKTVRAVRLNGAADASGMVEIRCGGRMSEADTIEWSAWTEVDLTGTNKADLFATGRLLSVGIRTSDPVTISGFTLDIATAGKY